jgi:putative membrane-bound dehydrogenase-like protein
MFRLALLASLLVVGSAVGQTHQVKLNGHTFTLPQGFTIELAAGADLAPRPIACDFDEKGRLYVTDSSGSNEKTSIQVESKPHRIVRLEDTDGDGKFDKQTVFVKNVMFPEGCMWLNGSLYVAAPPHIWKFTDTNDDGVADKEEIWFDGKTLTGCANDLHGPYRGPDGWIYWCKGAFAKQEYVLPNGKKFSTRASHIFRATPDGKNIEPVMTGGMDNPVDLVFTPGGDIIFSTTFLQHPRDGKRDGLIHAVYGAVYGKEHDPVYEHPWTYPTLMPPMTHLGPAAPCGLHRLESDQFGKEYTNNIFCCQFNMRKVSRHILVPTGSTYTTKDSDFVVSDNIDFHPTDVIEDADGSLLIVDTGGWYKLCCPTSQLVKPDVTGAIYRVKKDGAHKVEDPRGLKIEWKKAKPEELAKLLGDPRPTVRWRAVSGLAVNTGENNVLITGTFREGSEVARLHAIWAAARIPDGPIMLPFLDEATLPELSDEIRAALARVVGLHREDRLAHDLGHWLETKRSLAVRRAAAEALGRMGSPLPKAIAPILEALADEKNDRTLDHALTYALIEIGDVKETAKGLEHKSPRVRRAVLAALENVPDAKLDAKAVLAELDATDAALRDTAWWVAGRHPQWGGQLAGYLAQKLKAADKLKPEERTEFADRLVKFAANDAVQQVLGAAIKEPGSASLALHVMARSGLKAMPAVWRDALLAAAPKLENREAYRAALAVFRVLPTSEKDFEAFVGSIPQVTLWPTGVVPDEFKLATLASRPAGQPIAKPLTGYLLGKLRRDEPGAERSAAADALTRAKLDADQLVSLAGTLKTVNPLELGKLLGVFEKSKDTPVGLALVAALRDPAVRPGVRAELVKPILDKYPQAVRDEAEKLYAELAEARKDEKAKLEKLLSELKPGDIRRGQLVFNNAKTQCIGCHKVGYVGGLVGPDLTRVGGIRTERDLLEAIVFPSASFVRSYEPVRVVTTDERTFNGVLKKDAPDEIIIVVAADKEERIPRADVASITPSSVSLMPSGLDQQLSPQDLADLVAFLRACK